MFKFRYLIFIFIAHNIQGLTTLHVTLSSDDNPGGIGDIGDLRYCLNTMNQDLNSIPDDYAIVFDFPMTIQLNGILPLINNSANPVNITIGNPGPVPTVTIDGNNGTYSGFFIPMGNVTIQNMIFQNLAAKGGNGGNGISGGGGGLGAGGAIYVPQTFLNGSTPTVTLMNVFINNCTAIGGNGGNCLNTFNGDEGGGGGGGFAGNGGSIITTGNTGGGGGGGFGGDGGNVTTPINITGDGGGGGGGGGLGSRATMGIITNLGNGGSDQDFGSDGNAYGLDITAGSGGGGLPGKTRAGGGGGGSGAGATLAGGGGGGSAGGVGLQAKGSHPPGGAITPSGGNGGDGGGGGGGGVVISDSTNNTDGKAGAGGYGGGGGGGAGLSAYDISYTVEGGSGGIGGGGGGGGVNQSGTTSANGGDSEGGGGGGGGGPSDGPSANGGTDTGSLGGGSGGQGATSTGFNGGGGGGGGSGLGGAIFIDSGLNFTIQAIPEYPTFFNTSNNITQAGIHGTGGPEASDGMDGHALGNSIFLRSGSALTLIASNTNDILTLGDQVTFTDDTSFGAGGTAVFVRGNGTVIYNGTTDYQGMITINNANFKVNGVIYYAPISVCRNINFSPQRGTLSGSGSINSNVFVNSGTIAPETNSMLTLGSLTLSPANELSDTLGSLVKININASGNSSIAVTGTAALAGSLEIEIDANANPGTYTILTSNGGLTGTFDTITFTGPTPNYTLSYLPISSPTFVQFNFLGYLEPASNLQGTQLKNNFGFEYELYNQLTWTKSVSDTTAGYFIYRNGTSIATVSAVTTTYQDHNRPQGISTMYTVVAFDANGNTSSSITVTVP